MVLPGLQGQPLRTVQPGVIHLRLQIPLPPHFISEGGQIKTANPHWEKGSVPAGTQAQIGMSCYITSAELDINVSPPHPGKQGTAKEVGRQWGKGPCSHQASIKGVGEREQPSQRGFLMTPNPGTSL